MTHPTLFQDTDEQKLKSLERDVRRLRDCVRVLMQALRQDGSLSAGSAKMIETMCPHVAR